MIFNPRWTERVPTDPTEWSVFLPDEEMDRQNAWAHNKSLLRGWHGDVFKDIQSIEQRLELVKVLDTVESIHEKACELYIIANYCGLLSNVCAQLLFGEPIKATPTNGDPKLQHSINRIMENNQLQRINAMQARTSSSQGYTYYRVRWGRKTDWQEDGAIIEAIPGYNVYPHISFDNIKEVRGYTIAIIMQHEGKKYLRREVHTVGLVQNTLNIMDGSIIGEEVPLATIPELENLPAEWKNNYPGLFIQYVPNKENIDEYWGASDYEDIESLQDAINNRLSNIDEVLDKHSNPILVLPTGTMRYDPATGKYYSLKIDREAMEANDADAGAKLPRYVTWEAQLSAAFSEIDKLFDTIMLVSQISPTLFGLSKTYASDSAKALKIRMVQTLAKINDKQMAFDAALKNAIYAALWLEKQNKPGAPNPDSVRIEWKDGLPDDELEITQIHAARVTGGFESRRNAIKEVQGLEGDDLDIEEQRVLFEQGIAVNNPFDLIGTLDE